MDKKITDFLSEERICALTTILPDGSPHAAALHFSHTNTPLTLFFSTENTSKKCKGLLKGEMGKASAVIGFSEQQWITLQLDGTVRAMTNKEELETSQGIHYAKHPNSAQYKDAPETLFLAFTPTWWRYTDYNTNPITIISSEKIS